MGKQKKYNGYLRNTFTYNGKRYYVYGKTAPELLENITKKQAELERGQLEQENPTLNAYYEHFTKIRKTEVKEATQRAQRSQFKNISNVIMPNKEMFGDFRIKDITRRDIETARQLLSDQGKTPENINIIIAHLNHVFSNAVIDETIIKNPCKALKKLKRESAPINETKHRALSEAETELFFKAAEERNSFYINCFRFMINTGVRVGELGALYKTDIDTKSGFIHIRRTITRTEAGAYTIGEDTKTASGSRDIPITPEIQRIIREQESINRLIWGMKWSGTLFQSSEGDLLREYTVNREIKRICNATGINGFTCHAFRNTFATRYIEQRPQDYKILSEILGHKDISITLNLYTHVMTENKILSMNNINIKTS